MLKRHHCSTDKLGAAIALKLLRAAEALLKTQDEIVIAISGGNSILATLNALGELLGDGKKREILKKILWIETDAFAVSPDRPLTNRQTLMDGFFQAAIDQGAIPAENCVFFDAGILDEEEFVEMATAHERCVETRAKKIDIALFGIGGGVYWPREGDANINNIDPGHIAAIFPGYMEAWADQKSTYLLVTESPKPPRLRISLTPHALLKASTMIGILSGKDRLGTLINFNNPAVSHFDCPAKILLLAGNERKADAHLYTDLVIP